MLGAFSAISVAEVSKSSIHLLLVVASSAIMALCLFLAKTFNWTWLKEWALGIAILSTLVIAYFLHTAA